MVDHLWDKVSSRDELEQLAIQSVEKKLAEFRAALETAIDGAGSDVDLQVLRRVRPFIANMQKQLDDMREPTAEERRLYAAINSEIDDALGTLTVVFSDGEQAA